MRSPAVTRAHSGTANCPKSPDGSDIRYFRTTPFFRCPSVPAHRGPSGQKETPPKRGSSSMAGRQLCRRISESSSDHVGFRVSYVRTALSCGRNVDRRGTGKPDPSRTTRVVSGNQSGSSGNCWTPSGMSTPGSLRDVQIWIAVEILGELSSDPPLMLTVSDPPSDSCQNREPQFGQKAHLTRPPLSVGRVQNFGAPCVTRKPICGTMKEIPKA